MARPPSKYGIRRKATKLADPHHRQLEIVSGAVGANIQDIVDEAIELAIRRYREQDPLLAQLLDRELAA